MRLEMMGNEKRLEFALSTHGKAYRSSISIGPGTVVGQNVSFVGRVRIGENCRIKSGAVIGEKGFAWGFTEDGFPVAIEHLGGVWIGDNVEIGSCSTVLRGTVDDTIIMDNAKIDDHVHIAHNCLIGRGTIITACSELSGSVKVGEFCWLGPNCSIKNKVKIGDKALIGIGSVVISDVGELEVVAGNPARVLRMRRMGESGVRCLDDVSIR